MAFRRDLYATFRSWGDAFFELTDAVLSASGPVTSLPQLSLEPEFRRSHGSLYRSLAEGAIDADALRSLLVANRPVNWPAVFAVDASTVERCDAECSPERGFYYSASKHSAGQPIVAGWHYQWICQLSWAPDSWTAPVDICRIPPAEDPTTATVTQLRRLVALLPPDGEVPMFVLDAGYDPIGISHDLATERCEVVCRIRDDRVFHTDAPAACEPTARDRRAATPARKAVEVLRPRDLAGAERQPRRVGSPLRTTHRHCLARHASAPVRTGTLGGVRTTADRARHGDPRRGRASPETDLSREEDAVAVVVGRRQA